jgi:hypothetical protein
MLTPCQHYLGADPACSSLHWFQHSLAAAEAQHSLAAAEALTKLAADERNKANSQSKRAQAEASKVTAAASPEGDVCTCVGTPVWKPCTCLCMSLYVGVITHMCTCVDTHGCALLMPAHACLRTYHKLMLIHLLMHMCICALLYTCLHTSSWRIPIPITHVIEESNKVARSCASPTRCGSIGCRRIARFEHTRVYAYYLHMCVHGHA